ncbi:Metallo-hydrolase/oxidoreductase [Mycena kentingensis (nom. inval.)]|nr:Metallo-hydrolase/oxidoreductase [Mycena kentingensis (nom. inval.)]
MPTHTCSNYHKSTTTVYQNPWPPVLTLAASAAALLRLPFERTKPYTHDLPDIETVKTLPADFATLQQTDKLCAMWLGHAGYLVQLPAEPGHRPICVVFDPIFSERAFPSTWVGPRRRLAAPCTVDDLPEIDFVAISHNHYDHCDLDALKALAEKSPTTIFLVPLGVKTNLSSVGIPKTRIYELDWWDTLAFSAPDLEGRKCTYRFTCTPAQHNSGRGLLDQNWTLWCGWALHQIPETDASLTVSVYFAGDTGYQTADGPCPAFKEIGDKLGPFNLALVPIWSGASLTFLGKLGYKLSDETHLATLHATPEDAVRLASDVRARNALAMHFGTFAGSEDEALEPAVRLAKAAAALAPVPGGKDGAEASAIARVDVIDVGECVVFDVAAGSSTRIERAE